MIKLPFVILYLVGSVVVFFALIPLILIRTLFFNYDIKETALAGGPDNS